MANNAPGFRTRATCEQSVFLSAIFIPAWSMYAAVNVSAGNEIGKRAALMQRHAVGKPDPLTHNLTGVNVGPA